ncbi:MAG: hypothetical protein PHG06_01055 [Parabacteroides sp.]|nr:hypothetical protein [Parabacteroides sp.]
MLRINKLLITGAFAFICVSMMAQNNTNSPYTRYGYGDLGDRSFGAGRAMGGVGIGLRSPLQINPLNPASYSCMDSMTFIFDFGVAAQLSQFDDGNSRQHDKNGNVEYMALQFPISRRLAVSAGLLPYSFVGYKFGVVRSSSDVTYTESYNGTGGLTDFYGGASFDIWKKRLAVGANVGFLFGNILHSQVITMSGESTGAYNTSRSEELRVRDLKFDFGIQYTHPISKTEQLTFGATFSPRKNLHAKSYNSTIAYVSSTTGETLSSDTITDKDFSLPNTYGIGVSYVKQNKLTLAVDFSYENWKKMPYFGDKNRFNNEYRIGGGCEYIPNYQSKTFFNRMKYRAGIHYNNSYLRMNQTTVNPEGDSYHEIGASLGFGLPLIDNRSFLNISLEYVKKNPEVKTNMIDERYFRFTLNYTFNELWFFKRKVE